MEEERRASFRDTQRRLTGAGALLLAGCKDLCRVYQLDGRPAAPDVIPEHGAWSVFVGGLTTPTLTRG